MRALVCGSFAYDTILVFPDRFKEHILPDSIHMLNVCFVANDMRREFGGCAGNICYNLKLLGSDGVGMGTVGSDFAPYAEWLDRHGIDRSHIRPIDSVHTAQCTITTDLDDNQITAFYPGAMGHSHEIAVGEAGDVGIGIIAPDGREGMVRHADQMAEARIPFLFDPGQNVPLFDAGELRHFIDIADWVVCNDYEWELIRKKTELSEADVTASTQALIVTKGGDGSVIHTREGEIAIPPAKAEAVVDPTGCGDAYRAGILHGLMRELDWETTGRIASLLGAIKVAHRGTQNHGFTPAEFAGRYEEAFGRALA